MAAKATGGSLIADAKLKQLYATMLRCRLLAEHARSLRKRRATAMYQASIGQEAIATGCAIDLRPQDTITDTAHDSIAGIVKGVPLSELVARLYTRGRDGASPEPAEQFRAATTLALRNQQKNAPHVVVVFTNVATTTLNYWQETLKLASHRSLPMIFVVENNPWRRNLKEVALQAKRKRLTSITVDGNDVVAVYRVAYESLDRVRQGGGPVLVEAKTYRQDGQAWRRVERDPLIRMEQYLIAKRLFTMRWKNQLADKFARELAAATRYLRASHPPAND